MRRGAPPLSQVSGISHPYAPASSPYPCSESEGVFNAQVEMLKSCGRPLLAAGILSACADQHAMTDEKITAQVQKAIAQHPDLRRPNRIYVDTRDHTVYLTGAAYHPLAAENPQDLAGKVPAVSKVVNDI